MGLYGRTIESFAPNSLMAPTGTSALADEQRRLLERYEANVGQFGNNTAEILDIQSLLAKTIEINEVYEKVKDLDETMQRYLKLIDEYYPRLEEIINKLGELDDITAVRDDIVNVQKPYIDAKVAEATRIAEDARDTETRINEIMVVFNRETEATVDLIRSYTLASVYKFSDNTSGSESVAINVTSGSVLKFLLNEKTTNFDFGDVPPEKETVARQITLILEQGTGANLATWPASIKWSRNREPVLSLEKGRLDVATLLTYDEGITWLGFFNGGWFK